MSANIKTWQERTGNHNIKHGSTKHMLAEIADLRAALAAKTEAPAMAVEPVAVAWKYRKTAGSGKWSVTLDEELAIGCLDVSALGCIVPAATVAVDSPWIDLNDTMPKPEVFVLTWDGKKVGIDWWGSKRHRGDGVTHWAPFETPPGAGPMYGMHSISVPAVQQGGEAIRMEGDFNTIINGMETGSPWEVICQPGFTYKFTAVHPLMDGKSDEGIGNG